MNDVKVRSFDSMLGKVMTTITLIKDASATDDYGLKFVSVDDCRFYFSGDLSYQSSVRIADVYGDLGDLVGHPMLEAKEIIHDEPKELTTNESDTLWTFYRFSTVKGTVIVRFLGETTSPWYGITVEFEECGPGGRGKP
jgi:hypothetical protein